MNSFLEFKPFIVALDERIKALSKEELHGLLMGVGQKLRPEERQAFLDQFQGGDQKRVDHQVLLTKIQTWKKRVEARAKKIENGEMDGVYGGRPWYDRDEPDLYDEEHEQILRSFLAEADDYFLRGKFASAKDLYEELLFIAEDYSCAASHPCERDTETWARYIRSVYECREKYPKPLEALYNVLTERKSKGNKAESFLYKTPVSSEGYLPIFSVDRFYIPWKAVENATITAMVFDQVFVVQWEFFLEEKASKHDDLRAFYRLLEFLLVRGAEKIFEDKIRQYTNSFPQGWHYWTHHLMRLGKTDEFVLKALEALRVLSKNDSWNGISVAIASSLREVAIKEKDLSLEMEMNESLFGLTKSDRDWALRMDAARRADDHQTELSLILDEISKNPARPQYWKTLLSQGKVKETLELRESPDQFVYEKLDLEIFYKMIVPVLLTFLSPEVPKPNSALLEWLCTAVDGTATWGQNSDPKITYSYWILQAATQYKCAEQDRKPWWSLAQSIGLQRVDKVLSMSDRAYYEQAAMILVALVEYLSTIEKGTEEAKKLLYDYAFEKYKRLPAFKKELRRRLEKSGIAEFLPEKR